MDLSTIDEVVQTDRTTDVNERLEAGWVLLAVAPGRDDEGQPSIWYSLGFPGRQPPEA